MSNILSESDFTPAEWTKISSLCGEYIRLNAVKSEKESDMTDLKSAIEEMLRTILDLSPDSRLPSISSSNFRARPSSKRTSVINPNKLIEHGVEMEVIAACTETSTTYFLIIEDPNKRKGKGKKKNIDDINKELMSIFEV